MVEHKHSCKWCSGVKIGLNQNRSKLIGLQRVVENHAGTGRAAGALAQIPVLQGRINKTKRMLQEHLDEIEYGQEN